ncbi:MAG: hypothetical protein ACLSUW_00840 [Akkermansia sp.]
MDIALTRNDGTCFRWSGKLLPHTGENIALNETYVERIVKFCCGRRAAISSSSPGMTLLRTCWPPAIARAVSAI